ncbi:MAG: hypothetical protein IJ209_05265 [Bacteroidaceae bacterium]|nr:hypothetical protein [Bacteroidaceae bacterium]
MKRMNMSFSWLLAAFLSLSTLASSCRHDAPEPHVRHNRHTILLYIAAENTLGSYFRSDSLEIAEGLKLLPDTVQVALFFDNTKSSKLYFGSSKHQLMPVKTYDHNVCSTDSAEMEMVLDDVFRFFPAQHYGIIFWSHASGWVPSSEKKVRRRTFGIDNGQRSSRSDEGPQMEITTLANVLAHHPHTDYLFFDACFMQCIEVAYQLRHVTDCVIGSPAEIPADGAPYAELLPILAAGDIDGALRCYYDYYVSGAGSDEYGGAIISALRTDRLEALAAATRPLVESLFKDSTEVNTSDVQYYYPLIGSKVFTQYFDIVNFFYQRCPEETFEVWRQAFDRAVTAQYISRRWASAARSWLQEVRDPAHCGAVSIFVPSEYYGVLGWNKAFHAFDWYRDAGFDKTIW